MNRKYDDVIIDIGSSTVKVYGLVNGQISPIAQKSIGFKSNFVSNLGIADSDKQELLELLSTVKDKHPDTKIKLYATSIFRKLTDGARKVLIDEVFMTTGLYFNVVSHDLENFYLEKALAGKFTLDEPILLINIGGGSTELVVVYGAEAVETYNIDLGVGTINTKYPKLNNPICQEENTKILEELKAQLPALHNVCTKALYNGGELSYMERTSYKLDKNDIFRDADHPMKISIKNLQEGNHEVLYTKELKELEALMPEDPKWMHGARGCSLLAQAICEFYNIQYIIPSDSNMINGIARQEFRNVTISGSFRKHLAYILDVKSKLNANNVKVLSPRFDEPKNPGETFVVFTGEEGMRPLELERHHLDSIDISDALIVCAPNGYVGASSLIEIGYANAKCKRIIFTEKPEEFMLNTLPAEFSL